MNSSSRASRACPQMDMAEAEIEARLARLRDLQMSLSAPLRDYMEAFVRSYGPAGSAALASDISHVIPLISELRAAQKALAKIADGATPPEQHGHYLAHRECVRIAREALRQQPQVSPSNRKDGATKTTSTQGRGVNKP